MNASIRDMMNVLFPLRFKFPPVYIDMKRTTDRPKQKQQRIVNLVRLHHQALFPIECK